MRKLFNLLALIALPLSALRIVNTITNIDPATGFYLNENLIVTLAVPAIIVAVLVVMAVALKKSQPLSGKPTISSVSASFFCISAIATAIGSVFLLLGVFSQVTFRELFMSRAALFDEGYESTHFRIEFWCSLVGLLAAVWFVFAVVRFLKDGDLSGHAVFCCVPVIWFCVRALADYSIAPVNPNNTIILVSLAANLFLAVFYFRFCRFASLGYPAGDAKKLVVPALLVFIFTISLKLPLVIIAVETSFAEALFIISDSFAAAAALCIVDRMFKGDAKI